MSLNEIPEHREFENLDSAWYVCHLCGSPHYYPESETIVKDGRRYCKWHYRWRFYKQNIDDMDVKVKDNPKQGT